MVEVVRNSIRNKSEEVNVNKMLFYCYMYAQQSSFCCVNLLQLWHSDLF